MNLLTITLLLISLSFSPQIKAEATASEQPHPLEHCGDGPGYMFCMTNPIPLPEAKPCDFTKGCSKTMFIDEFGNITIGETIQLNSK